MGAYEYLCLRESALNGEEDNFKDISRLFVYYVGRLRDKQLWNEATPIADEGMTLGGAIDALSMKGACTQTLWPFDLSVINQKPDDTSYSKCHTIPPTHHYISHVTCRVALHLQPKQ